MFDDDDIKLPFERDNGERDPFSSVESALHLAHVDEEEGVFAAEDALIYDFPNNPDLISYMLNYYLRKLFMERADEYFGMLMKTPDEELSIRSHVAVLSYMFVKDPDGYADEIESVMVRMRKRFPFDMVNRFALDVFHIYVDGGKLTPGESNQYYQIYKSLEGISTDGEYYSEWVTSVLPLVALIVGEYTIKEPPQNS